MTKKKLKKTMEPQKLKRWKSQKIEASENENVVFFIGFTMKKKHLTKKLKINKKTTAITVFHTEKIAPA